MTKNIEILDDQAVFGRTTRGQQELLAGSRGLSRTERRFLGMETGFTQVQVLLDMGLDLSDVGFAVSRLLKLGLIEQVKPDPPVSA